MPTTYLSSYRNRNWLVFGVNWILREVDWKWNKCTSQLKPKNRYTSTTETKEYIQWYIGT